MKLYIVCFAFAVCLLFAMQVKSSPLPDVSDDINNALSSAMETMKKDIEDVKPKWDSFVEDSKAFFENVSKKAQEIWNQGIPKTD